MPLFFQNLQNLGINILEVIKGTFISIWSFFRISGDIIPFTKSLFLPIPMFIVQGMLVIVGIRIIKIILDLL